MKTLSDAWWHTRAVAANIPIFQQLANLYYEGVEDEVRTPVWTVFFAGVKSQQPKPGGGQTTRERADAERDLLAQLRYIASKPSCPLHKVDECIFGEARQISSADAAKIARRYDLNGEIQEES